MDGYMIWIAIALVAFVIEVFTTDFTFLILGTGALGSGGVALAGGGPILQGLTFVVVAAIGLALLRPYALKHFRQTVETRTNADALPGKRAKTLTEVTVEDGRIKLHGEEWTARLDRDVSIEPIPAGHDVIVTRIDGATALIHDLDN